MKLRLAPALVFASLSLPALAADLQLSANETRAFQQPGATAAFSVDPAIVEAAARDGRLHLVAHRAGETAVSVVSGTEVRILTVTVSPAVPRLPLHAARARRSTAHAAAGYDTALERTSFEAGARWTDGPREIDVRAHVVHDPRIRGGRGVAVPAAAIRWRDGERHVGLLDQYVEGSPLLLDGVVLRGAHARDARTRVHAGLASTQPWEDALVPAQGDRAVLVSRDFAHGSHTWTPSVLWLPDADARVPGAVALGVAGGTPESTLRWRGDLGWSDRAAASVDLDWRTAAQSGWVSGAWRPAEFAALDGARSPGGFLEGAWSTTLPRHAQASVALSATRVDDRVRDPRAIAAHAELRTRLGEHGSAQLGLAASHFQDARVETTRTTLTVGASHDTAALGLSAQYRYQESSGYAQGGHGARLAVRAQHEGFRATAHVDAQQNAPGLALSIAPGSNLGRALAELGVLSGSPEQLLRLFAEHGSVFARHGVSLGEVSFDALRLQAGLDLAWQPASGQRIGLRVHADETRGAEARRRNLWTTLFGAWRLPGDWELETRLSRWSFEAVAGARHEDRGVQLLLRKHWTDPTLPFRGHRAIRGRIVPEPGAGAAVSPSHIEVRLDGGRRVTPDAQGRFEFEHPGPGEHTLVAVLPHGAPAYFTGPSSHRVQAGDQIEIGVARLPAQVHGTVRSDAGVPLPGVTVILRAGRDARTVTDGLGRYRFATVPGEVLVELQAESLPPGYDLASASAGPQRAEAGAEAVALHFRVPAQRSVRGRVEGAPDGVRIEIPALGKSVAADAAGAFILRGLPAGEAKLVVHRGGRRHERTVLLPPGPGRVDDVVLPAP